MKSLVEYARKFVKTPYIWGGSHPSLGFDCSGLVQVILDRAGLDPVGDNTAQGLYNTFSKHKIDLPETGALVFYGAGVNSITHVDFMISPTVCLGAMGGTKECVNVQEAIKRNAWVKERPFGYRKDFVAVLMPPYEPWTINE
jgi:cell wall-associated NlpC family hydrolase